MTVNLPAASSGVDLAAERIAHRRGSPTFSIVLTVGPIRTSPSPLVYRWLSSSTVCVGRYGHGWLRRSVDLPEAPSGENNGLCISGGDCTRKWPATQFTAWAPSEATDGAAFPTYQPAAALESSSHLCFSSPRTYARKAIPNRPPTYRTQRRIIINGMHGHRPREGRQSPRRGIETGQKNRIGLSGEVT